MYVFQSAQPHLRARSQPQLHSLSLRDFCGISLLSRSIFDPSHPKARWILADQAITLIVRADSERSAKSELSSVKSGASLAGSKCHAGYLNMCCVLNDGHAWGFMTWVKCWVSTNIFKRDLTKAPNCES